MSSGVGCVASAYTKVERLIKVDVNMFDVERATVSVQGKLSEDLKDWYVNIRIRHGDDKVTLFFNNCNEVRLFVRAVIEAADRKDLELASEKEG